MANGPGYTVDAGTVVLTFDSVDALAAGQFLAAQIKAQSQSGQLVNTTYVNGASSPGGTNLLTVLSRPTTPTGFINLDGLTFTDHNVITVVPGYTDVVASVPDLMGLSQIAVGSRIILSDGGGLNVTGLNSGADGVVYVVAGNGNNSIFTAPNYPLSGTNTFVLSPPGHYFVATGSGDDEINIGTGSGTVEPGGGHNEVKLVGNSIVISNGYDSIVGNTVPLGQSGSGGTDTIAVGAGQTTINPGSSSFLVNDGSSNVFSLFRGAGSDTVYLGGLGGGTVQGGLAGNNLLVGGIGGTASAPIVLQGGGTGDLLVAQGGGAVTLLGGSGNETLNGGLSVSQGNLLQAGMGNETLVAGSGADTLAGALGAGTAVELSGTGSGTTFRFVLGAGGGQDTIAGLKASDTLQFNGYGSAPLALAVNVGGSLVTTLSDGTSITLAGVTSINPAQIRAV